MQSRGESGSGRTAYDLGPLIGSGTFGDVYLATMISPHGIEQRVAVKLLHRDVHPKSQPMQRMRDEGRMLAAVNHPAILQVIDMCFLDGRIGLVTEFIPGADLSDCLRGAVPMSQRAALKIVGVVADALHAAHTTKPSADARPLGLVHRDIKPANVRVTPHATVKLLDFGIAKAVDVRRETQTARQMMFGTPSYMAPEVITHDVAEALHSRDVFALGCTLYEALTGQLFYEGLDQQAITQLAKRGDRYAAWCDARLAHIEGVPREITDILGSALYFDESMRPSAHDVSLACLEAAETVSGQSLWQWARAYPWPTQQASEGAWTGRRLEDAAMDDAPPPPPRPLSAAHTLIPSSPGVVVNARAITGSDELEETDDFEDYDDAPTQRLAAITEADFDDDDGPVVVAPNATTVPDETADDEEEVFALPEANMGWEAAPAPSTAASPATFLDFDDDAGGQPAYGSIDPSSNTHGSRGGGYVPREADPVAPAAPTSGPSSLTMALVGFGGVLALALLAGLGWMVYDSVYGGPQLVPVEMLPPKEAPNAEPAAEDPPPAEEPAAP